MDTPLLQVNKLSKTFGSGHTEVRAVDDVSLDVRRGELILMMGPSGSGKTTLVSMLGTLLRPSGGRIVLDGTVVTRLGEAALPTLRARKIGFVFQAFNLMEALTVEENVLFPAQLAPGGIAQAKPRADELLARLGLDGRRRALPPTLSGGEKQRVAIARALINAPPLILADEPTGNLDSQSGQEVVMILHDAAREAGCAVVIVTHDPRVEEVADRILWLEDGRLRDRRDEGHAWTRCPVCGMRVDEWTAQHVAEHAGERAVFCSQRCRERFVENPVAYAA
ncbi:MAG: ATP-binding cassette domain-containing protein [Betaproteobacteria bacterium]|nr:ATP-binding cassette domain-containing protein [Betaproteobacteria bacterium]